jgi:hypothetical protein
VPSITTGTEEGGNPKVLTHVLKFALGNLTDDGVFESISLERRDLPRFPVYYYNGSGTTGECVCDDGPMMLIARVVVTSSPHVRARLAIGSSRFRINDDALKDARGHRFTL